MKKMAGRIHHRRCLALLQGARGSCKVLLPYLLYPNLFIFHAFRLRTNRSSIFSVSIIHKRHTRYTCRQALRQLRSDLNNEAI